MLVLTTSMDSEEIKRLLVSEDSSFFLVPSTNPSNTYRVLWYSLSSQQCKVDILTPGVLGVPPVPPQHIQFTSPGIPAMPFLGVLLLKLKSWKDHQDSYKTYLRIKQYVDARDINELLTIAVEKKAHVRQENWLSSQFISEAQRRVTLYVSMYPSSRSSWHTIGFESGLRYY